LAGDGSTFGPTSNTQNGGSFGNTDFYAPGDARNIWGTRSKKSKKTKKRKMKNKMKFPLYRRNLIESIDENANIDLDCMIITQSLAQVDLVNKILKENNINAIINDTYNDCITIEFKDKESLINKIIESNAWDNNKCVCFIGEMV
jgi:hypothetical protein